MAVPNLKSLVARVRKNYPAKMSPDQVGEAVHQVAVEAQRAGHDVGVLLKRSGHYVPSPVGDISADILVDIPDQQEYDIFTNADGADAKKPQAGPVWNKLKSKVGGAHSGASMTDVRRPLMTTQPAPTPTPEPPAPAPEPEPDVRDMIAGLRREMAGQFATLLDGIHRLEADNRKSRKVSGSAGWLGRIDGEISGVE